MKRDAFGLPDFLAAGGIGVRMTKDGLRYSADWLNDHLPDEGGYAPDDPKSEGYHGRMADVWGVRDRAERLP